MNSYLAAIFHDPEGGYYAEFPDLPGCVTQGETLPELDAMLRDALYVYLDGLKELGRKPAEPGGYQHVYELVRDREDFHALVLVTLPQEIKRERINVSLLSTDLEKIDRAAAARNMRRSEFMVKAAVQMASNEQASC